MFTSLQRAPVGYDRSWTAPNDSYIATLAIGYADGLSRSLSHAPNAAYGKGGSVEINGSSCKIAGKVCMDTTMVNMGSTSSDPIAKEGDHAILFGRGGPSLRDVSALLGAAQHDLTCGLSRRVDLRYTNTLI